jgi:hypothetical protein
MATANASAPLRVLVITGGNHPYERTTPILRQFLRDAGMDVTVTEDAGTLVHPGLADVDVLVLNTLRRGETDFSEAERAAMLQFTHGGKAFVPLHVSAAAGDAWEEWLELGGAIWKRGVSRHPYVGPFTVEIRDGAHPITAGMQNFDVNDELYIDMPCSPNLRLLATAPYEGRDWPMAFTMQPGRGRVFYTALGHDAPTFENAGFQTLVTRGIQWAARRI